MNKEAKWKMIYKQVNQDGNGVLLAQFSAGFESNAKGKNEYAVWAFHSNDIGTTFAGDYYQYVVDDQLKVMKEAIEQFEKRWAGLKNKSKNAFYW